MTCAEVVRKMLRWHPDAALWFDYSTTPLPTIHVRARGDLPAVALPFGGQTVDIGDITRHDELFAPAVVVHYETAGTKDGQAYSDFFTDAAPAGATGTEFGAVVLTIPLRGASTATVSQSLIVRPISDSVEDPALLAYLKLKDPALVTLDDASVTRIDITSCTRRMTDPAAVEPDPGFAPGRTRVVTHDLGLTNELVQGAITPWMIGQYADQRRSSTRSTTHSRTRRPTGRCTGRSGVRPT